VRSLPIAQRARLRLLVLHGDVRWSQLAILVAAALVALAVLVIAPETTTP
jgi:hypothetical protein